MRPANRYAHGLLLVGAVILGGCQGAPYATKAPGLITVVTTTTVFADMVRNVGGDSIQVTSLVPKNGDVHTYAAKPSDIQAVADARLLVMNGLGLDDWLERTIANASAANTTLVKLAVDLPGVTDLPGDESGSQNPHLFMDVAYAELYVDRIEAALAHVDPPHAAQYHEHAAAYRARLAALDQEVRDEIGSIPQTDRRIVTFHDAFPYYARAYGLTIVGVAVAAPGQDPSAGYTVQLIDAIKAAHVKAIFSEAQFPPRLVDQLAAATGVTVVADLYDDALGDDPVTSYEALIRWDTDQLVQALR
jgi:ABC-type Zn uptake system ZnuABC Zn-binding protein ZnuA